MVEFTLDRIVKLTKIYLKIRPHHQILFHSSWLKFILKLDLTIKFYFTQVD